MPSVVGSVMCDCAAPVVIVMYQCPRYVCVVSCVKKMCVCSVMLVCVCVCAGAGAHACVCERMCMSACVCVRVHVYE